MLRPESELPNSTCRATYAPITAHLTAIQLQLWKCLLHLFRHWGTGDYYTEPRACTHKPHYAQKLISLPHPPHPLTHPLTTAPTRPVRARPPLRPQLGHHLQEAFPGRCLENLAGKLLYLIIPFLLSQFYLLIYSRSQPALAHSPATYFYKFSGTQPPRFIHLLSTAPFSLQKQSWRTAKYTIGRSRPKIVPFWPFTEKKKKKNLLTLVPEEQRLRESSNLACLVHYYIPST